MTTFDLLSLLVTLAALFALVSHRVLRLPTSVGTTILALVAAGSLIAAGHLAPGLRSAAEQVVYGLNFDRIVLHGMLAFLLFAGALQLNIEELSRQKLTVSCLAVLTTGLSVVLVACLFYFGLQLVGVHLSRLSALLFGALISPTDPIAVLEMLRRVGAPPALEAQLAGESLFNDGIGAVIFLTLVEAARTGAMPSPGRLTMLILLKAAGAIGLGVGLGYLTCWLLTLINQYRIEVMLTLALAMGGYALADGLHLSAPLEVVTAGLTLVSRTRRTVMSRETREHVDNFWELVDDIFNVVLFLMLGMEILVLPLRTGFVIAGLLAIPIVLLARYLSVSLSVGSLRLVRTMPRGTIRVLTWGGLRGGLAVALALSVPGEVGAERSLLLVATYVVVVFSIVVQGLTIAPLLRLMGMTARKA